jgi:hypothetical protein
VGATLKMKGIPVVSPAPQTFDQIGKNNIHILEKVIYEGKVSSVIPNFLVSNVNHENVVFVIKELCCINNQKIESGSEDSQPIILKNVLLCAKKRLKEDITDIKVIFTQRNPSEFEQSHNGTWFFSTEIENLAEKSEQLFNTFVSIKPVAVTLELLKSFASNLFNEEKVKRLQNEGLTVDTIIKELEAQIN